MTRKRKDYRELKVSSFSGYGYKSAPMLRIQGLWLEELGFKVGDPILVKCEDGKLVITLDHDKVLYQRQRESIMAEVAKLEGKTLKGGHGDHHFNNRDEVGKEYGLSGSSVGRLLKVNDLIIPLRHKLDNGSLIFKVGIQISFLTEEEQQLVYEQMMELRVKLTMAMAIKLREHSGALNLAMVRRYLTKTVEPKDRPMNIKVAEKISKKYFKGKDQKTIDDILEKALAAWFAAEGKADV